MAPCPLIGGGNCPIGDQRMKRTDPVCGMEVEEKDAVRGDKGKETYYFCSESCRDEYMKTPAKGAKKSSKRKN